VIASNPAIMNEIAMKKLIALATITLALIAGITVVPTAPAMACSSNNC
jgi:hypothetical protein